jgi:hypothetical protein
MPTVISFSDEPTPAEAGLVKRLQRADQISKGLSSNQLFLLIW